MLSNNWKNVNTVFEWFKICISSYYVMFKQTTKNNFVIFLSLEIMSNDSDLDFKLSWQQLWESLSF